ncbi:MAG: hypothetical protein ACI4MH_04680 [Candidatus Coproplasma sp.]
MAKMFNVNKEMKKMQAQQEAQQQLNELISTEKNIDKMINEFFSDAKERLLDNDETGFELIASSIFYFQDIRKVVQTIRVQFQTYIKTAQFIDTIDGIRPVLRKAADMMSSMPSMNKNNKDFIKFKKGLMKGQLNMKAMSSMMTAVNPATTASRSKEEFDALKERLLMPAGGVTAAQSAGVSAAQSEVTSQNEDFFAAINSD